MKSYKYLDIAMVISVVTLLLANFAGNSKITQIGELTFTSGVIFFPVSYLLGDVLTEVYGYSKSRRVIWISFGALVISAIIVKIMIFSFQMRCNFFKILSAIILAGSFLPISHNISNISQFF